LSSLQLDQAAHRFLEQFDPEALVSPKAFDIDAFFFYHLQEHTGVKPGIGKLPIGIEGATNSKKMTCVISENLAYDDTVSGRRRRRSTTTHECSHAILHVQQTRFNHPEWEFVYHRNHEVKFLNEGWKSRLTSDPEWQAWRWTSYVLMPTITFLDAIRKRNTINMLAEIFDVNPAFVQVKCRSLGIKCTERGTLRVPRSVQFPAGIGV
jgi:hypothetical protein